MAGFAGVPPPMELGCFGEANGLDQGPWSMIRRSGYRFSEKIPLNRKA